MDGVTTVITVANVWKSATVEAVVQAVRQCVRIAMKNAPTVRTLKSAEGAMFVRTVLEEMEVFVITVRLVSIVQNISVIAEQAAQSVKLSARTVMKNVQAALTMRSVEDAMSVRTVPEEMEASVTAVEPVSIVQNISAIVEQAAQSVQPSVRIVMKNVQNAPMMRSVEAVMSVWIVSEGKEISV